MLTGFFIFLQNAQRLFHTNTSFDNSIKKYNFVLILSMSLFDLSKINYSQ